LVVDNALAVPNVGFAKAVICEVDPAGGISIPYVVSPSATSQISDGLNVLVDVIGAQGRVWYIDNFEDHIENSYYQPSTTGASYLDRLEGKKQIQSKYSSQTDKEIGLESFIKKQDIPSGSPVYADKTNIDYLYFSSGSFNGDKVKGISTNANWFRIDNGHQQNYTVEQITE
jgi:hypothetical protein